jgi:transcription termination/antitermination protein NusG
VTEPYVSDPFDSSVAGGDAEASSAAQIGLLGTDEVPVEDALAGEASVQSADDGTSDSDSADGAASDVEAVAPDPLEEFRESLRSRPGDWFVVHTYSGMEKRVKTNLENRIGSLNMEDYIFEVHVPQEEVWEIKNGQRRRINRTVLPGYVLVRMDLTDESWAAVRHTPSVTGFVGHSHQPTPLSLDEVEANSRRSSRSSSPTSTPATPSWWSTARSRRCTPPSPRSTSTHSVSRRLSRSSAARRRST